MKKIKKNLLLILIAFIASVSAVESNSSLDKVDYLGIEVSNVILFSEKDTGKVVYASPGEIIQGQADCVNHRPTNVQVIVGFEGIGAQDGINSGCFNLIAPEQPGIYEVRFRYAEAHSLEDAIAYWWKVDSTPPWQATIGLVIVSEDPENDKREIHDNNWKSWLTEKYKKDSQDVETSPLLTSNMVNGADFWDLSKSTGNWKIDGSTLSNQGTLRYNKHYQMISKQAFEQFQINFNEKYQYTKNLETAWWSHSRGFGVLYYVNDQMNIEFRYFADVGQLSLYIRDGEKIIERIQPAYFHSGENIGHSISVKEGQICWKVNDQIIFIETTTLKHGHLMLTNHNNAVIFEF